jgi:hypothetical protein
MPIANGDLIPGSMVPLLFSPFKSGCDPLLLGVWDPSPLATVHDTIDELEAQRQIQVHESVAGPIPESPFVDKAPT